MALVDPLAFRRKNNVIGLDRWEKEITGLPKNRITKRLLEELKEWRALNEDAKEHPLSSILLSDAFDAVDSEYVKFLQAITSKNPIRWLFWRYRARFILSLDEFLLLAIPKYAQLDQLAYSLREVPMKLDHTPAQWRTLNAFKALYPRRVKGLEALLIKTHRREF